MSIFGSILGKIFPSGHPAVTTPAPNATVAAAAPAAVPTAPVAAAPAAPPVDVEQVLTFMATTTDQKLNWQTSIVDLLKLLQLNSDFASRKELAKELGYTGDTNDSASMNIWLHKQVMVKLEENGGMVPASLKV